MVNQMGSRGSPIPPVKGLLTTDGKAWDLHPRYIPEDAGRSPYPYTLHIQKLRIPHSVPQEDDRIGVWIAKCENINLAIKVGYEESIASEVSIYQQLKSIEGFAVPVLHGAYAIDGSQLAMMILDHCGSIFQFPNTRFSQGEQHIYMPPLSQR